jgi:spore coat protein U-like protein
MKKQMGRLMAGATVAALVAGAASYSQQRAEAATHSASVVVSASVAANCLVSAGTVVFGAYDPLGANDSADLDADGTFTVRCTRGVTAQVGLDDGLSYNAGSRRMKLTSGTEYLNYSLYSNSGHSTAWDNTANRVSYTAANKSPQTLTIYGRVPGGQDPVAGSYEDTVQAVAEF